MSKVILCDMCNNKVKINDFIRIKFYVEKSCITYDFCSNDCARQFLKEDGKDFLE